MIRRRFLLWLGACGITATSLVLVLTFGVSHRPAAVFSTISNGLSTGGLASVSDQSGSAGFAQQAPAAAPTTNLAAPKTTSGAQASSNDNLALGNPPGDIERTVVASYVVPHQQFYNAFNQVISHAVDDEGGFVVSTTTSPDDSGRMVSGTVVVKVPTAKLSSFLAALPTGTFTPSSINFATVDHTSEYIDDSARLAQAQQELAALQRALAATSDPATVASLTQQITDAQANLEHQQATFAVVQQAVALSTATVHIKESGAVAAVAPAPQPVLARSTQSALGNDVWIVSALIYGLLTALPFLVLVLILTLARRRIARAAKAVIS